MGMFFFQNYFDKCAFLVYKIEFLELAFALVFSISVCRVAVGIGVLLEGSNLDTKKWKGEKTTAFIENLEKELILFLLWYENFFMMSRCFQILSKNHTTYNWFSKYSSQQMLFCIGSASC